MKSQQKDDQQDDKLLFGLVLFDTKEKKSKIEKAIQSILKIDYPADKLKIIICSYLSEDKKLDHYVNYANILLSKFRHTRLLLNHKLEKDDEVDYNAFMLCKYADYFVKMNHDEEISSNIFKNISKANFSKDSIIKQGETIALPKNLVSKNYLDFNDYDRMSKHLLKEADKNNSIKNIT
jgi:hypothetical protein